MSTLLSGDFGMYNYRGLTDKIVSLIISLVLINNESESEFQYSSGNDAKSKIFHSQE
jgi:hypothetical protein